MEIAVVGATAVVTLDGDVVSDARVAITSLSPTIRRVPEAEHVLTGSDGSHAPIEAAARATADASEPIDDVRGSAGYRQAMAEVIARRAISGAIARARGEDISVPASSSLYGQSAGGTR
jgi:carbon-monoxide dehydrogenase medium subunit